MKKVFLYSLVLLSSLFFVACGASLQSQVSKDLNKTKQYVKEGKADLKEEKGGSSALHYSTLDDKYLAITKYLIENGADINILDFTDRTPLLNAIFTSSYYKPLNEKTIKYLIEKGADIHLKSVNDTSPLQQITSFKNTELLELLLKKGAKINEANNGGSTALHFATYYSNLAAIKVLLKNGAKLDVRTNDGFTPLHFASKHGETELVKVFLENGADVNKNDNFLKWTPLHFAAFNNNFETVKVLLANGALTLQRDSEEHSAYYYAFKDNYTKIVEYLDKHIDEQKEKNKILAKKKKEKETQKYVNTLIKKNKYKELKSYTDKNPNAVYYISNEALRLALTGPKGMKVGDIRKLIKEGNSEVLVISLIKRSKSPYKEFSLKEIKVLQKMGLSDNVIASMIDVTTLLLRDEKLRLQQERLIKEQQNLAKNQNTKVIIKERVVNQNSNNSNNLGNEVLNTIGKEVGKEIGKKLFDKLF